MKSRGGGVRLDLMREAAAFFVRILNAPARIGVACENPVMHGHALAIVGRNFDQSFQPYDFGDPESKRTCLWLSGLPKLVKSNFVLESKQESLFPSHFIIKPECGHWNNQTASGNNKLGGATAAKTRAKTYHGIAEAMAEQWGKLS